MPQTDPHTYPLDSSKQTVPDVWRLCFGESKLDAQTQLEYAISIGEAVSTDAPSASTWMSPCIFSKVDTHEGAEFSASYEAVFESHQVILAMTRIRVVGFQRMG